MAEALAAAVFGFAQQVQAEEGIGGSEVGQFARRQLLATVFLEFLEVRPRARHTGQGMAAQVGCPLICSPAPLILVQHDHSFRVRLQGLNSLSDNRLHSEGHIHNYAFRRKMPGFNDEARQIMGDPLNKTLACEAVAAPVIVPPVDSIAWLPGGPLPSALETGHQAIDFEHRQLLACMMAARSVCTDFTGFKDCSGCIAARRTLCENELVRLLGDLLSFILDHFKTEEEIMRDSLLIMVDRDLCEAHMEDHAAISLKIQQIVSALDSRHTVNLLRDLDNLLGQWITNHIAMHDMLLVRWVEREDSALSLMRDVAV
jgi:hemerythrin-like metal-binding protein